MTIRVVPSDSQIPFLLATDIDGTLLGSTSEQSWLCDFVEQYPESMYLAYMTGRSLPSVRSLIEANMLPPPHFVCSHVGTQLFDYRNKDSDINARFTEAVDITRWDLEYIYRVGIGNGIQRQVFTNGQPPFHAGFFWDGNEDTLQPFRERIASCASCSIVVSHGMFIDVIPEVLGKGNAVYFLQEYLEVATDNIVIAGDSGNDCCMFDTPFRAIVPANSYDELKALANKSWHYHSPFKTGEGVVDGLCHFGFIQRNSPEQVQ